MIGCDVWFTWTNVDVTILGLLVDLLEVFASDDAIIQAVIRRERCFLTGSCSLGPGNCPIFLIAGLCARWPLSPGSQCCVPRTIWKLKALVFLLVKRLLVHPGLVFQKRTVLSSKLLRNTGSWPKLLWNCVSPRLTVAWAPIRPTTPARIAWTWNQQEVWSFSRLPKYSLSHFRPLLWPV